MVSNTEVLGDVILSLVEILWMLVADIVVAVSLMGSVVVADILSLVLTVTTVDITSPVTNIQNTLVVVSKYFIFLWSHPSRCNVIYGNH